MQNVETKADVIYYNVADNKLHRIGYQQKRVCNKKMKPFYIISMDFVYICNKMTCVCVYY